jgi:hypothetical protein
MPMRTKITRFKNTNVWFGIVGETFECGGRKDLVSVAGFPQFTCPWEEGGIAFNGYQDHEWHIIPKGFPESNLHKPVN